MYDPYYILRILASKEKRRILLRHKFLYKMAGVQHLKQMVAVAKEGA